MKNYTKHSKEAQYWHLKSTEEKLRHFNAWDEEEEDHVAEQFEKMVDNFLRFISSAWFSVPAGCLIFICFVYGLLIL